MWTAALKAFVVSGCLSEIFFTPLPILSSALTSSSLTFCSKSATLFLELDKGVFIQGFVGNDSNWH